MEIIITLTYRTASVDRLKVFYREAGDAKAPTVLLLHGFPTSSHMYRDLIPALADRYRPGAHPVSAGMELRDSSSCKKLG